MADALGIKKFEAIKSFLETMQAFNSALDSLTSATPAAPVCMDGHCMDATEVTESAYAAVKGSSPSSNGPQMPVTLVRHVDASEYCTRVGKRLPTAAEWKKFAGPNEFATADGKLVGSDGKKEANFNSSGPMPVGSFQHSYGLYDMTGNVSEWVSDGICYKDSYGGSWRSVDPDHLHVDSRYGFAGPKVSSDDLGFRCIAPEKSKK